MIFIPLRLRSVIWFLLIMAVLMALFSGHPTPHPIIAPVP